MLAFCMGATLLCFLGGVERERGALRPNMDILICGLDVSYLFGIKCNLIVSTVWNTGYTSTGDTSITNTHMKNTILMFTLYPGCQPCSYTVKTRLT